MIFVQFLSQKTVAGNMYAGSLNSQNNNILNVNCAITIGIQSFCCFADCTVFDFNKNFKDIPADAELDIFGEIYEYFLSFYIQSTNWKFSG